MRPERPERGERGERVVRSTGVRVPLSSGPKGSASNLETCSA
jgi:hypothetical protein